MSDVLTTTQRKYCMSRIRGKNTIPELKLRKALWRLGFRYRIKNSLPGKPDIIFSALRIAIFVDGCFWHCCPQHFIPPKSNAEFWKEKLARNVKRDMLNNQKLELTGWFVIRFWEHEIYQDIQYCTERITEVCQSRPEYKT